MPLVFGSTNTTLMCCQ